VVLQHRGGRLLDLQEQRVLLIAALQQDDVGARADAADTDHLAGQVDELEPLQQVTPSIIQGGPVAPELLAYHAVNLRLREAIGGLQVAEGHHDRGLADDPVAAVDQLAELGQRLEAVAGASLLDVLAGPLHLLGFPLGPGGGAGRVQDVLG
jgi:hypothetical protein